MKIVSKNFEINFKRFRKVFWKILEKFKKYFGNFHKLWELSHFERKLSRKFWKNGKTLRNIFRSFEKYYRNFFNFSKKISVNFKGYYGEFRELFHEKNVEKYFEKLFSELYRNILKIIFKNSEINFKRFWLILQKFSRIIYEILRILKIISENFENYFMKKCWEIFWKCLKIIS